MAGPDLNYLVSRDILPPSTSIYLEKLFINYAEETSTKFHTYCVPT